MVGWILKAFENPTVFALRCGSPSRGEGCEYACKRKRRSHFQVASAIWVLAVCSGVFLLLKKFVILINNCIRCSAMFKFCNATWVLARCTGWFLVLKLFVCFLKSIWMFCFSNFKMNMPLGFLRLLRFVFVFFLMFNVLFVWLWLHFVIVFLFNWIL